MFFVTFIFCLFQHHFSPQMAFAGNSKIIVGVLENWPPQYATNEKTKQPEGFAVEIINEIGGICDFKN